MENTEIYIKYRNNEAVPIDLAYGRGPEKNLPLLTVAHLVAAFQARPGSLLADTDSGLITLYSNTNGVETKLNSWDPLTVLGQTGTLGTNPLIIRSKNDMEVNTNTQGTEILIIEINITSEKAVVEFVS